MQPHDYTLNKKSLNGPGNSMVTVLHRKLFVQLGIFATTVFSWLNQGCEINLFLLFYGLNPLQLSQEKEKAQ